MDLSANVLTDADLLFDFLCATASHLFVGDSAHAPFPLIFFLLPMGSYFLWHLPKEARIAGRSFETVTS
jgi:hypothetical protein